MIDISEYQPTYYKKSKVMTDINNSLNIELKNLVECMNNISVESNAITTVDMIEEWERSVGLNSNSDLTLEQRRSRVLSRYRQIGASTLERIKVICESYSRGSVEIIEKSAEYTVIVKFVDTIGVPDNMDGLIQQLKMIMPAHICVNFEYKYRTWRQVLNTGKTWRQIKGAGYTWNDLMIKEEL